VSEKVLVTAALLYANGQLHFGHLAGAYLAADIYARFERLQGKEVLFVSGSDEFGLSITLNAEMAGRSPQEHVDLYDGENRALFEKLNFSFDHFARTTWEGHPETVNAYFEDLLANGYIEAKETEQLYSPDEDRFLADRYVTGTCPHCGFENARGDECQRCGHSYEATDLIDPKSKLTGAPLERRTTRNWFLLLDKFKDQLQQYLAERDWKPNVTNFAKHYLRELRPRAITRDASWGVPVPLPEAEGKVFYVWFDAPIGYISASKEWAQKVGKPDAWKDFWTNPKTRLVHFIGKDNIFFHALFFPAMTMGQNAPYILAQDLPANEFLNLEGKQFSKSEGWFVDLADFLSRYSADQVRWTLAANAPESHDSEFSFQDFQQRCNGELLGKLGNLANRALVFAQRRCDAKVPPLENLEPEDKLFLDKMEELTDECASAYREYGVRRACHLIMEMAATGNAYFDQRKPWDKANTASMPTTIACCLRCLQHLALCAFPIIPESATRLRSLLGPGEITDWSIEPLTAGSQLPEPQILFQKIEDDQIAEEEARLKKS
jgi:methionyl-tRNA synthetase